MRKFNKWWVWLLVMLVLITLVFLGVLYSSRYDNAGKISVALLFQPHGRLNERAFAAAMNARFPEATKPGELLVFIKSLDGQCATEKDSKISCSLDEAGVFCVAGKIRLDVQLGPDHTIKSIDAKPFSIAC
jgi:hypothetical protein